MFGLAENPRLPGRAGYMMYVYLPLHRLRYSISMYEGRALLGDSKRGRRGHGILWRVMQ